MSEDIYPLSVIVHTKNSAKTLKKCLDSVYFAKEIIVLDMKSEDDSRAIAKKYTKKVLTVDDVGYVEPVRNFGIKQATEKWILLVDADEQISEGLKIWLESFLSREKQDEAISAYFIPRKNYIFGQEIQHTGWWPDYQLRLFKKGSVRWDEKIHSVPEIQGESKKLPADRDKAIIHYNYSSVDQFIERMNRYTSIMAAEKNKAKEFSSQSVLETFSSEFIRRIFEWEGKSDGALGLSLSLLQANSELVAHLKLWEKTSFKEKNSDENDSISAITEYTKVLKYWIADWHVKNSSGLTKFVWMIKRKLRI